ncbi:hypothetical protein A0128_20145 [Leptospira tipperaryensis]|uniref:Uncharacterized protein n=1 Tax=Leptospira tipperaryensis TaxID=2564040 RepID=A0A1D7V3D2_9LEPT|nr:hypothetical protein [Leptospira tipperaryensis]AOP36332.1 hypothetical protein A0128_20145 [Leptospira tipperaryensis]
MTSTLENKNIFFIHILKSIGAVFIGLLTIFITSLGTDQILHVLNIYPPWGEPMFDNGLNALALSYRLVYGVLGCYITAFFAPKHPMRHALILGGIGLILSTIGAIAAMNYNLGPIWYPISLIVTGPPSAWLGGKLRQMQVEAQ